ncbi:hypothetical protein FC72_GL001193 [Companilactobacillus tucceti DSM 20183]|uniref:Uncharacterized protein n=1 Tax=Companilactobacillus tucceti DSM 20183 TaxID=1423811 RepID=A0A0R1IXI8_9LACO|nr:hypothetical protein [Companilactobacillus tucceti]KRK63720.1 hypothetical protein FC72_GL001193 [Companilactobacillus tucceti DSM 20183]
MQESESNEGRIEIHGTPEEIKGWNWGAFAFNIWWGIGNKSYLPLLCIIPIFNFIWMFVCGFKGNEWAWNNGDYKDVETFKEVQKTWNLAGLVYFIISIVIWLFFLSIVLNIAKTLSMYGL